MLQSSNDCSFSVYLQKTYNTTISYEHKAEIMDFQDLNHLTEESEAFTPLKLQSFQIAEDLDQNDVLEKIPHGLTAKKNRRKSYQQEPSHNELFSLTPQRVPLTAPRPNVLNSRPIGLSPLNNIKRSLTGQLKALKGGKENFSPVKVLNTNDQMVDPEIVSPTKLQDFTPSSPERLHNKRHSLFDEPEATKKHQKLGDSSIIESSEIQVDDDDLLLVTGHQSPAQINTTDAQDIEAKVEPDVNEKTSESDEELVEQEEFSRIDAFENDEIKLSETIPTQVDDVQVDIDSKALATPSRLTEPVAISPKTEQCSRVVDESGLLLDTSKSPFADDSYVSPDSPLSQHNNSVVDPSNKNVLESLDELDDIPESYMLHERSRRASNPKSIPFFTISQVHEIQEDFKKETAKLEENIREKSLKIGALSNEINESKNKIYQLKDEFDSVTLQKMQISKENDLLKSEFEVFKNEMADMELVIKSDEDKLRRHQHVISKFKERVKELNESISAKQQEIETLSKEIERFSALEQDYRERESYNEQQKHELELKIKVESEEKKSVQEQLDFLQKESAALKNTLEDLVNKNKLLKEKLTASDQLIQDKELAISEISTKFQSEESALSEIQAEKDDLIAELEKLNKSIDTLKSQLEAKESQFSEAIIALQNSDKQLLLKDSIIIGIKGAVRTLKEEIFILRDSEDRGLSQIRTLSTDLEEATELLTIRKAEVAELNIELEQFRSEMKNLKSVIEEKNYQIDQLNDTISESSHALEFKNAKIKQLDDEIQKQESEHLAELESFHKEMSNVQAMLSSKSNELFKLREERDFLQREHDMLKYELGSVKEEFSDSDVRISNLKVKLNDAKNQCQSLEETVQTLRNEKASFEKETEKRLQQLAEDLYIQYSKKHEQKVQVLKKNYESKWQSKVHKLDSENERLRRDIEGLNSQLEREKAEKNEIIKLWDQFKENEGAGITN